MGYKIIEEISKTNLICVEGKDEVSFFSALFKYLEINDIQILDFEGKTNFKAKIKALGLTRGFKNVKKVALIRDADENPEESAFQSLVNILTELNYTAPENNKSFSTGNPNFGIFIMPGEGKKGALEDLCLSTLDGGILNCIESYFKCIEFFPLKIAKAKVLCYLSGKEPYANSLGIGALKGHWKFENKSFDELITFLKLFS